MSCASEDAAIRIDASGVVLDLDDRLIDGTDTGLIGIRVAPGNTDVLIRNGTISDFDHGIRVSDPGITIENMTVSSSDLVGLQAQADGVVVQNSTFVANGDGLTGIDGNRITGNAFVGNSQRGALLGDNNVFQRNYAAGNSGDGLEAGSFNRIVRNIFIDNFRGIRAQASNKVRFNKASLNARGIRAQNDNYLYRNRFNGNGEGADLTDGNRVIDNRFKGNGGHGLDMEADNVAKGNRAHGNEESGIFIEIPSNGTILRDNRTNDNVQYGIDAGAGPVRSRGNKAKRNNQLQQCRPAGVCQP